MIPSRIKRHGLYRLYWHEGGFSLASVGSDSAGRLWFAACNWISGPSFDWGPVKRAVYLDLGPVRGTVVRTIKAKPARPVRALLRDIILLDGDESNPFGGGEPPYRVPSLDAMAAKAARILGTTREAVKKRAGRRLPGKGGGGGDHRTLGRRRAAESARCKAHRVGASAARRQHHGLRHVASCRVAHRRDRHG